MGPSPATTQRERVKKKPIDRQLTGHSDASSRPWSPAAEPAGSA